MVWRRDVGWKFFGVNVMRVVLFALLAIGLAFGASAAEPKKPKPVDIKKEILDKCGSIPYGLVEMNGKTATKDEMEEGKFQVTAFITQVDVYQECLVKLEKALGDRLTDYDRRVIVAAADASQQEKEAVAKAYNQAVDDYNKTHK